ncbi:hypothetical protein V5799_024890 [Amblyomma americanum]|uniref:THAP-type domain-containing protein n=1 Tax=Amblyomma americanum TaxID=6943 RepID=A0AAQ4EB98_AMBAM
MTLGRFLSQWHASAAKINASGASRRFRAAPGCRQLSDTAESETSAPIDNKDAAMPSCCVPGCRSRTPGQEPGVTFHTFPKDPERKRQWTEAVRPGQRDWEPAKWSCVCSKHFLPEHFDRMSSLVVRIRADAVPLQAPMDVAESQETLAGPSQQAPMDVTESQETLPGPSQQASMDVATMLDIQPGPSQAFQLTPVSFISSCVVSIQVYSLHEVGCRCNSAM